MKRNRHGRSTNLNWKYCFICQSKDVSNLRDSKKILKTLAENLLVFWKHGKLDLQVDALAKIGNGEPNFYESFIANKASVHHQCYQRYSNQKVQRILNTVDKASSNSAQSNSCASSGGPRRSSTSKKKLGFFVRYVLTMIMRIICMLQAPITLQKKCSRQSSS